MTSPYNADNRLPQMLYPIDPDNPVDGQQNAVVCPLTSIFNNSQSTTTNSFFSTSQLNLQPTTTTSCMPQAQIISFQDDIFQFLKIDDILDIGQILSNMPEPSDCEEMPQRQASPLKSRKSKKTRKRKLLDLSETSAETERIQGLLRLERQKINDSEINPKYKRRLIKNFKIAETALEANMALSKNPATTLKRKLRNQIGAVAKVVRKCFFCKENSSTQWRRLFTADVTYITCNACGLYYKKHPDLIPSPNG